MNNQLRTSIRCAYTISVCLGLSALISLSQLSMAAELSALEVMTNVDARYDGDSAIGSYTMVLINRRQQQRSRDLKIYSKDFGRDAKTLSVFESPADIRGTTYLNFDWDDSSLDNDSWLYLPSLQRVKRIASSDTSDSFLGSDFTYADINGLELDWYDYSFISDSEVIDGHDCWLIEIIPKAEFKEKAEQATGYSKTHSWIRKDNLLQVQGQVWLLKGNRIKYFTASQIEQIQDIWTIKRLQVVTTRNGKQEHASVLQINEIQYNISIDDQMFTTQAMQRSLD
ncbi:MAG: outer membrane lipoprotein-sorting protein [SAR86 cluster bacterium]|uniref:Outer membrane lipoprotein-sorting protein n=1 Tax=SAR86 cluster bacterium TaxID=2030880 RepID=A0A2A4MTB6_9GAMM|nr:MAG: outer membrane lipoprotein-sorting protein [SAR86 cluster bacterium]